MIQTPPSVPVGSRLTWREIREKLEREDYERSHRSVLHPTTSTHYSETEAEILGRRMFRGHD